MSNLYVVSNVDGREESDLYSFNDKSYNSWRYGDEASLYSIAEDSREDRASEVPSMAATDKDHTVIPRAAADVGMEETTVEVSWAGDEPGSPQEDSEQQYNYEYQQDRPRRRKFLISTCALVLLVLAIILGVTLSSRDDGASRSTIGDGVSAGEEQTGGEEEEEEEDREESPPATPMPDVEDSPTASPVVEIPASSAAPTHSQSYVLAQSFVSMALGSCPGAVHFNDPDSTEKQTFDKLVGELVDRMSTDDGGFINFPLEIGIDYLKEKYALEMFYQSTNGESWFSNDSWMNDSDPCEGWHGITSCRERKEGSCGVEQINLGEFLC